jgi:hypothetical protein
VDEPEIETQFDMPEIQEILSERRIGNQHGNDEA